MSSDDGQSPSDDKDKSEDEGGHGTSLPGTKTLLNSVSEIAVEVNRHLSILRVNRQIYSEASAFLHSSLIIGINPGDALTNTPGNAIVSPNEKVWRHAPSKGPGFTNINGQIVYKASTLDGFMEPHVFARFEKVLYIADFEFERDKFAPSLDIKDDLTVRAGDPVKFVSYLTTAKHTTQWLEDPLPGHCFDSGLRETVDDVADITISSVTVTQPSTADIIQKFFDLIASSPFIRHLEFILTVGASRGVSIEDTLSTEDETESEQDAKYIDKGAAVDERATELLLESGVLNPLQRLTNVRSFSLKIATYGRGGKRMTPQKKHLDMIGNLKKVIEKNWITKQGHP